MSKSLAVDHPHAVGIDIASRSFYVHAVDEGVIIFPTYTEGCHALRDYLKKKNITTAAMESNGVYQVILYAVLE